MNQSQIIRKGLQFWVVLSSIFWSIPCIFGFGWTRSLHLEDAIALLTLCLLIVPSRQYSRSLVISMCVIAYFTSITAILLYFHITEGAWPLALPDLGLMAKVTLILINKKAEQGGPAYPPQGVGSADP